MVNEAKTKPTMHEVAAEAKTSVASVSRVINGKSGVSPDLEKRVNDAMKKLHYHPSSLARSLKIRQTMLVGIVVPLLEHPAYGRMASGIEKSLFDAGYRGLICNSEENEDRESAYIEILLRQRVDGIILNSSTRNPNYITELQKNNIPIVLFDRSIHGVNCHQVFSDNLRGGYMGVQYLAELGHTRIGIAGSPLYSDEYPEPIAHRLQGARDALKDYGADSEPDLVQIGDTQIFEMGYLAGKKLLSMGNPPTAIFALTDATAVGLMHAATEMGVSIPNELSIVGFDDLPIASYTVPPLTTIAQPLIKMGQTAAELLIQTLRNPDHESVNAVLPTKLIVRASTAPPKR